MKALDDAKKKREAEEEEKMRMLEERRKQRQKEKEEKEEEERKKAKQLEEEEERKRKELEEKEKQEMEEQANENNDQDGYDSMEEAVANHKPDKPASAPAPPPQQQQLQQQQQQQPFPATLPPLLTQQRPVMSGTAAVTAQMRGLDVSPQQRIPIIGQQQQQQQQQMPPRLGGPALLPPLAGAPRMTAVVPPPAATTSNGAAAATAAPRPPQQQQLQPQPNKINVSEFEPESDPFESLELKTINNYQALASLLQTSTAAPQQQQQQQPQQSLYTNAQQQQNIRQPIHSPGLAQQQQQHHRPAVSQPGQFPQQPAQHFRYPSPLPTQQIPQPYAGGYGHQLPAFVPSPRPTTSATASAGGASFQPPYPTQNVNLPPNYHPVTNPYGIQRTPAPTEPTFGTLKSSKSFGDIVAEIKGEEQRKKHMSVTPPPRASNLAAAGVGGAMEDWVPWPDLDGGSSDNQQQQAAAEPDPLASLGKESQKQLCRQVRILIQSRGCFHVLFN